MDLPDLKWADLMFFFYLGIFHLNFLQHILFWPISLESECLSKLGTHTCLVELLYWRAAGIVLFPSRGLAQPARLWLAQPSGHPRQKMPLPRSHWHFLGRKNLWLMEETSFLQKRTKGLHTLHKCKLAWKRQVLRITRRARGIPPRASKPPVQVSQSPLLALHFLWKVGGVSPRD